MKKSINVAVLLAISHWLFGQNPLVTHMFTADPTARVFEDKLYVYPSTDTVPPASMKNPPRFCMPGYHVFSLENGATWKDHGSILNQNEVPWGTRNTYSMWAPDCIERGGKYYFYYPAEPKDKSGFRRIGVGVSDSPTGPFKWEKNYIEGVNGIDPGLMIDDKGDAYLFFGGGQELFGAPLEKNMKEIAAPAIKIEGLPHGYKEGSFPFQKDGIYYLTFAHGFHSEGYTIGYATSDNPLGPFQYRGKIMDNIGNGTNHHSVVKYQDRWILFYHYWDISGYSTLRSMCADYIEFDDKGSIKKIKPTKRGIGVPTLGDTIQVDRYNSIKGASTTFVGGNEPIGWMVCDTKMMGHVRFNDVNFGEGQAKKMQARVASGQRIGHFEVRIDSEKGTKIAEFPIEYTGGWNSWTTIETDLLEEVSGTHDIYVVFVSVWGSIKAVNLNWLLMN